MKVTFDASASDKKSTVAGLFAWLRKRIGFVVVVLLPTVLTAVYLNCISTDRYVSESKLVVKRSGGHEPMATAWPALLGGVTNQVEDVVYLNEYLQSNDVLLSLNKRVNLKAIYTASNIDYVHRLSPDATQEAFLKHFRSMIAVHLDELTGILTLSTYAFNPTDAQKINRQMVTLAEEYINNISYSVAREQTRYVEKELVDARKRFEAAQSDIIEFQNKHHLANPRQQVQVASDVAHQLESSIVMAEADLKNMLGFMNPEAPKVVTLKNKLSALRAQLGEEKKRITGGAAIEGEDSGLLNELAGKYTTLEYQLEFATQVYKSTVSSMEALRAEIAQKVKNVVLITAPYLPEEPEFPRGIYTTLTIFGMFLLIYLAGRLVIATVEEHRD